MKISIHNKRRAVLGFSLLAPLLIPVPGYAQESEPVAQELEEVVVTGSRIVRGNLSTPTPVTTLDSEALKVSGVNNIADLLREVPSVGLSGLSSQNSNFNIQNSGLNTIDLRNLNEARTLVLVNGRRYVSGVPGSSATDMNTIPTDLIDRVEVITGGASAVYGSDAVAGVVNFILKDNFEGFTVDAQYGVSGEGDAERYKGTLTMGNNFADDRGNAVLHIAYNKEEGLKSKNRGIKDEWYDITDNTLYSPNHSSYVPQGLFFPGNGAWTYDSSGNLINEYNGARDGFDRSAYRTISIPQDRVLISGNGHFDINDDVRFYSELMFAQVDTKAALEPFYFDQNIVYADPNNAGIPISNPLIPDPIRAGMVASGTDRLGFRRRFAENEGRSATNERKTSRVLVGLKGDLTEQWSWDANYAYGRTKQNQLFHGEMNTMMTSFALDAEVDPDNPGSLRCVDAGARALGCVPLNIFGRGAISDAALAFVAADTFLEATITQEVFSAGVTNSSLFQLPAGDVGFAAGVEHRKESSKTINDPLVVAGLTGGNKVANTIGDFSVTEVYAEATMPLLSDARFAEHLGLEAAFRYADYDTVGGVNSWKFGGDWAPVGDIRFRSVYAKSTRAPNVNDLFAGAAQTFPDVIDPCNGVTNGSSDPTQRACLLDPSVQAAVNAGPFVVGSFEKFDVSGYNQGNPNLEEEEAKTLTLGAVITPSAIDGLSASIDYFNIEVDNAIQFTGRQLILDRCYASDSLDNFYCNQITRRPNTGHLQFVNDGPANQGYQKKSGVDFKVNYEMQLNDATLAFNLYYVRMLKSELETADGTVIDQLGDLSTSADFKNKANFVVSYNGGPLTVSWKVNYLGEIYDSLSVHKARAEAGIPDYDLNHVDAKIYNNMQVRYAFGDNSQYEIYGGIDNVFDESAPFLPTGTASTVWGNDTSSAYSPVGRYLYFGARTTF